MRVPKCKFWDKPHIHSETPSGIRCDIVNQLVEETSKPVDYATLKKAWFKKKEEKE